MQLPISVNHSGMGFKIQKGKNNCFLLGIYLEAVLFLLLEQPLVRIHLSEIEKKNRKKTCILICTETIHTK